MNKFLATLCIVLVFACNQQNTTSQNEKEAIKAVVDGETHAYMEKDYDKWASFWDHNNDVLRLDVNSAGFSQSKGWHNNSDTWETFFKENPEKITSTYINSNYLILYDANLAWLAFDQEWKTTTGEKTFAKATITLVKKDNSWKIKSYTAIQINPDNAVVNTNDRL